MEEDLVRGALARLSEPGPPAPTNAAEWLVEWRELAHITYGITNDDPRFEPVMRWLNIADYAFSIDSWPCFLEAAVRLKEIAKGQ